MSAINRVIITALVALFLLAGGSARADETAQPFSTNGPVRIIMVLRKPGERPESPRVIKEPDVTKLGGSVLSRHDNVVVIDLPLAAVKHLRDDENVAFLQRVWMGEPLDTWTDIEATSTPGSSKLHARALETGENLSWSTGTIGYDGSGNIKSMSAHNDQYVYDTGGRLIQSTVNGMTESYKYDSFGNLTEKTLAGAAPKVVPVDPASNRISGVTYDAIGDQINNGTGVQGHYAYDGVGMMTGVAGTSSGSERRMIYTAEDERIGYQVDPSFIRWRLRDFTNGQILREWTDNTSGGPWQWEEDFMYGEGKLVGGEKETYFGGTRHYSLDHLGSVRMVTSQARLSLGRHDYYPFGIEQTAWAQQLDNLGFYSPPEPMKFAGQERDFLGYWDSTNTDYLDDMHARYYSPNTGRFLSVDPVLDLKTALKNPQGWNRYAYVKNNPVNRTDPDGRCDECLDFQLGREQLAVAQGKMTLQEYNDRNTARGIGALIGASPYIAFGAVRGGIALFEAARVWIAAGMPLAGSGGREMFQNALGRVQSFAGSMMQKADLFEKLTGRIDKATGGSWSAARATAVDGSQVFLGRQGEALIINGEGQLFRAQLGKGLVQTKEGLQILWDLVRSGK